MMKKAGEPEEVSNTLNDQQKFSMTDLNTIFTHFSSQDIEEFYQLYQLWSLHQKREEILARMHEIHLQIVENDVYLQATAPSTIAQATLSQFRASGVNDIDLLDRMLERGDEWLDHTLQLFGLCERLDMLQGGNVTQWCIHALEGAYDWIESMADSDDNTLPSTPTISTNQPLLGEPTPEMTVADILKKLMSEEPTPELEGDYEETQHALPNVLPEVLEEREPIHSPTQDQPEDLPPTEPDSTDETIEPPLELETLHEEPLHALPNVSPEVLEASEPTYPPIQDQPDDLLHTEPDSTDETIEPPLEPEPLHALPNVSPEVLEASEPTYPPIQDQPDDPLPTEPDGTNETIESPLELETLHVLPNALPEVLEEREPTSPATQNQTNDLLPTALDNREENLIILEDAMPDLKTIRCTETPSPETNISDNRENVESRRLAVLNNKPKKLYSEKQKQKYKKQKFHQENKTQEKTEQK